MMIGGLDSDLWKVSNNLTGLYHCTTLKEIKHIGNIRRRYFQGRLEEEECLEQLTAIYNNISSRFKLDITNILKDPDCKLPLEKAIANAKIDITGCSLENSVRYYEEDIIPDVWESLTRKRLLSEEDNEYYEKLMSTLKQLESSFNLKGFNLLEKSYSLNITIKDSGKTRGEAQPREMGWCGAGMSFVSLVATYMTDNWRILLGAGGGLIVSTISYFGGRQTGKLKRHYKDLLNAAMVCDKKLNILYGEDE